MPLVSCRRELTTLSTQLLMKTPFALRRWKMSNFDSIWETLTFSHLPENHANDRRNIKFKSSADAESFVENRKSDIGEGWETWVP